MPSINTEIDPPNHVFITNMINTNNIDNNNNSNNKNSNTNSNRFIYNNK